jgi:methionyl-tRNA formyltransferase
MTTLHTIFMGTPEIAVPALRLLASRSTVTCVVTQPDRPAGRGHHPHEPPVKTTARALGLPVWQPDTLKGQAGAAQLAGSDLIVVMAYGELLRQDVLDLPRCGCVNLHASLLPRWRGASPLQAAIRAGDRRTGVSVMRMVRALDAGPVYLREEVALGERTTLPELHDLLAATAATALDRFLVAWPEVVATAQDEAQATFCRKLTSADGHLDFSQTADELARWVRAYTPSPGCWAMAGGDRLRILALEPRPEVAGLASGAVRRQGAEILVGSGGGACALTRLQPPGSRAMDAAEFINGHPLPDRLG